MEMCSLCYGKQGSKDTNKIFGLTLIFLGGFVLKRKTIIDIQLRIMYYKNELKNNPKCIASKALYDRNVDKLKRGIYATN